MVLGKFNNTSIRKIKSNVIKNRETATKVSRFRSLLMIEISLKRQTAIARVTDQDLIKTSSI